MGVVSEDNIRPKGLGVRHAQTLLLFLAMLLAFTMRVNMSMAIVSMTDKNSEDAQTSLPTLELTQCTRIGDPLLQ
ncbi:hypothetical protein MSG28_009999 [Choristoneura fumiferana]|uniref:Uncharacterized protein n=1 Tax=Choristoneura fumiferana TaxID=7141 RepID=A0ACC0KIU0_CHOFU|nr:hypothetical protein MSG28_009999 [Choristoneura fumiferana]